MIATLEFTLPEETQEHLLAVHAPDLVGAIRAFTGWLRNERKMGFSETTWSKIADQVWDELHRTLQEHGVEDLV